MVKAHFYRTLRKNFLCTIQLVNWNFLIITTCPGERFSGFKWERFVNVVRVWKKIWCLACNFSETFLSEKPCLLNLVHVLALNLKDFWLKIRNYKIFLRFFSHSCRRLLLNEVLNKICRNKFDTVAFSSHVYLSRADLDCRKWPFMQCSGHSNYHFLLRSDERRQSIRKAWTTMPAIALSEWSIKPPQSNIIRITIRLSLSSRSLPEHCQCCSVPMQTMQAVKISKIVQS